MRIDKQKIDEIVEQEPCNLEGSEACEICTTPCLNNQGNNDEGLTGD